MDAARARTAWLIGHPIRRFFHCTSPHPNPRNSGVRDDLLSGSGSVRDLRGRETYAHSITHAGSAQLGPSGRVLHHQEPAHRSTTVTSFIPRECYIFPFSLLALCSRTVPPSLSADRECQRVHIAGVYAGHGRGIQTT